MKPEIKEIPMGKNGEHIKVRTEVEFGFNLNGEGVKPTPVIKVNGLRIPINEHNKHLFPVEMNPESKWSMNEVSTDGVNFKPKEV